MSTCWMKLATSDSLCSSSLPFSTATPTDCSSSSASSSFLLNSSFNSSPPGEGGSPALPSIGSPRGISPEELSEEDSSLGGPSSPSEMREDIDDVEDEESGAGDEEEGLPVVGAGGEEKVEEPG